MPPVPPERRGDDGSAPSTSPNDMVPCSYCVGVSVYTKAMWRERRTPECKGIQVDFNSSRERLQEMRDRAAHPRKDDFTFIGVGLSAYSPAWMEEGKHLPYVKGLGIIAVHTDNDDLMKQIEERKHGDDDDDLVEDEDDDDLFDFDDGEATDDGQALVEKKWCDRIVEKTKYSVNAMYTFWERRLDGFSDRYLDSCRRLTEQMEKQVVNTPRNAMWLVHRIDEYVFGKDGGDQNLNGITILELSCANGQLEVIIKHGAHVDVADDDGDTALMAAAEDGHDAVVQRLLESGASIDLVNNDGWTSLMKASMNGHSEIVAILLQNGACVDKKRPS
ncbi:Ankyrin repeat-containing domain [Phytophthora cactorum]|nr:Ankyrin repeat-containing domain [Phytophthora cactorum]